jgi:hypothetical protein
VNIVNLMRKVSCSLPSTIAVAASLALACSHATAFRPALAEQSVPQHPGTASGEAAGVRLATRAGGWDGWPGNLEDRLTPVEVTVENRSGRTLRIRPEEFRLIAPNGFRYTAMSPADVGQAVAALVRDRYGPAWSAGFYAGPPWAWGWQRWGWPWYGFAAYPYAYGPWPPYWLSGELPQPGPQGALQDGGQITVRLFFPLPARTLPRFELTADLVDDTTGDRFDAIRVQFMRE